MKKFRFVSILLIMIVSVLPVICILMIHHISLCKTIENIEEGSFGKSLCMAHIKENSSETGYVLYEALTEQNVSCGIYLDDKESVEKIVRYIAFTKDYIDFPMQMGRFFKKDDFKKDRRVAVIGKNIEGTYEKKGKTYISIDNKEYCVIGRMGYEEETSFDNYIFVNLLACDKEELNIYSVDFFDDIDGEAVLGKCNSILKKTDSSLEVLGGTDSYADSLTVDIDVASWFLGLLLCYIVCVILISYQWLMLQRRELGICRMLGASKGRVMLYIMGHYCGYMLISFIVGFVYCHLFYPSYSSSFYKGFFISISILVVFMFITLQKIKGDSIEEVIKA